VIVGRRRQPELPKIDEMCFSTAPWVTTKARLIAVFVRPCR
jgi:hypothetical protein